MRKHRGHLRLLTTRPSFVTRLPRSIRRCRTAASTLVFHTSNKGSIPFIDANCAPTRRSPTRKTLVQLQTDPLRVRRRGCGTFPVKEIKTLAASPLGRATHVGVVQRLVLPSLQRTTRVRFPSPILRTFAVGAGAWSRLISAHRTVRFRRLRLIAHPLVEALHAK